MGIPVTLVRDIVSQDLSETKSENPFTYILQ